MKENAAEVWLVSAGGPSLMVTDGAGWAASDVPASVALAALEADVAPEAEEDVPARLDDEALARLEAGLLVGLDVGFAAVLEDRMSSELEAELPPRLEDRSPTVLEEEPSPELEAGLLAPPDDGSMRDEGPAETPDDERPAPLDELTIASDELRTKLDAPCEPLLPEDGEACEEGPLDDAPPQPVHSPQAVPSAAHTRLPERPSAQVHASSSPALQGPAVLEPDELDDEVPGPGQFTSASAKQQTHGSRQDMGSPLSG